MTPTKAKATAAKESESQTAKGSRTAGGAAGTHVPRRPPGTKDVPAFEWKLLGESSGAIITLFKAIERDDVEAQLERLARDAYYKNLRIVEAEHVIKQPSTAKEAFLPPKSVKEKVKKPKSVKARKASGGVKKAVARKAVSKKAPAKKAKASRAIARPRTVKKAVARKKSAGKAATKKASAKKRPANKRPAKKKK